MMMMMMMMAVTRLCTKKTASLFGGVRVREGQSINGEYKLLKEDKTTKTRNNKTKQNVMRPCDSQLGGWSPMIDTGLFMSEKIK